MKKIFVFIAAIMVMSFTSCHQKEKTSTKQNDIVGVYQYTGNLEGMTIWTEKYFISAAKRKNESSSTDSINQYENEYRSLVLEAGTWTKEDSIVTCTYLFAKNPSLVGETFRFTYNMQGDSVSYYVLNDNNERNGGGTSIKLKQSNTQNEIIGMYQYTGERREGMSAMFDDYFIYALRWKHDPLPVESEDYYEEEYKSLIVEAGKYTLQDSIVSNYMLLNKHGILPPSDEPSFRWTYSFNKDTIAIYILNEQGQPNGNPMYTLKLE